MDFSAKNQIENARRGIGRDHGVRGNEISVSELDELSNRGFDDERAVDCGAGEMSF